MVGGVGLSSYKPSDLTEGARVVRNNLGNSTLSQPVAKEMLKSADMSPEGKVFLQAYIESSRFQVIISSLDTKDGPDGNNQENGATAKDLDSFANMGLTSRDFPLSAFSDLAVLGVAVKKYAQEHEGYTLDEKGIRDLLLDAHKNGPTNLGGNNNLLYCLRDSQKIPVEATEWTSESSINNQILDGLAKKLAPLFESESNGKPSKKEGLIEKGVNWLSMMIAGSPIGAPYMEAVGSRGTHRPSGMGKSNQ